MKERGILFSAPMVLALLAGTKTQTRRVVKDMPADAQNVRLLTPQLLKFDAAPGSGHVSERRACPYATWLGDRLWVRETWAKWSCPQHDEGQPPGTACYCKRVDYRADSKLPPHSWKPSIFMPRWASRITLEITEVRVERLRSISEADAIAEGVEAKFYSEHWTAYDPETEGYPSFGVAPSADYITKQRLENIRHHPPKLMQSAIESYRSLWESINGAGSWAANPWVWALTFRRVA